MDEVSEFDLKNITSKNKELEEMFSLSITEVHK